VCILTDRYLIDLWSQAVRAQKGTYCFNPECGNQASGVHHIVKRRHAVTRYDPINGVPLCSVCHPKADRSQQWALSLIPEYEREHLANMSVLLLQDYLQYELLTRKEWHTRTAAMLRDIIKGEI
jgi:hypothetical protein